jgi:CelD/BcsL family acetyltransferase involved in cellulose biosynthesis
MSRIETTQRKARKAAREIGPLRFEFESFDRSVFDRLLAWKSSQLTKMRSFDVFHLEWVRNLLGELSRGGAAGCRGTLSALWAGDQLLAAHFGLRNDCVLHWWITAYDVQYERYSPGAILLLRLIDESARRGIRRIDLGKGTEPYKASFQSGTTALAEGAVARASWQQAAYRATYRLRQWVRSSSLRGPAHWIKQQWRDLGPAHRPSALPNRDNSSTVAPRPVCCAPTPDLILQPPEHD